MKNYIYFAFILLISCLQKEPPISDFLPEINLSTAYPLTNLEVEVTGSIIASNLVNAVEYGIVWGEKPNSTINDNIIIINTTTSSNRFSTKIPSIKLGSKIFIRGFVRNSKNEISYSNEFEVSIEVSKIWKKLGDLPIEEGQYTGITSKIDDVNLTFLRLDQDNNWVQYKHYKDLINNPTYTWQPQKFAWPQVAPREEALFFTVNFSKDYLRPAAFFGGGYIKNPKFPTIKTYVKDLYWVFDTQNYLEPMPIGDGPIAHFTLNRNEYLLEENNTDKFWSYFAIEQFIRRHSFPKLVGEYDYIGTSTNSKGYIIAQNKNESEVLLFQFDDKTDTWTQKSKFSGNGRLDGTIFSFKNKVYYGLGRTTKPIKGLNDIWQYNPETNTWKFVSNYPGAGNIKVMSGDMGDYVLLFCGYQVRESSAGSEKYYNANDTWLFKND